MSTVSVGRFIAERIRPDRPSERDRDRGETHQDKSYSRLRTMYDRTLLHVRRLSRVRTKNVTGIARFIFWRKMNEPSAEQQSDLAREIRNGDRTAEAVLVRTFSPPVEAMLRARTRDPSSIADLRQDVMIAVLEAVRAGDVREPEKLAAFIRGVTRNIANSWVRDRVKRSREDPLEENSAIHTPGDPAEAADRQRMVRDALDQLNDTDREILMQTLVRGEKPGAIASRLRLGVDVVRQRKSRAVKKVADFVKKAVMKRS
jgi:RNA polymerase sigma-70 factor (ECF subfamily)